MSGPDQRRLREIRAELPWVPMGAARFMAEDLLAMIDTQEAAIERLQKTVHQLSEPNPGHFLGGAHY